VLWEINKFADGFLVRLACGE